jgi:outer membrane lipoprotein carrier protein
MVALMASLRPVLAAAMLASSLMAFAADGRAVVDDGPELAQALQRRYDTVKDFSADFVHTYQGGVLRKQISERGRVLIKKPGKMRWDYTAPEPKLFVSDGMKIYSYLPQDKQVIVSRVPGDDQATMPALFLAGKGNLTRDFTASIVELPAGLPANMRALKLVPKMPQRDYDSIVLAVDPTRLEIRGLLSVDTQGGTSTLSFTNLKENVGLADKEFTFTIPRGVDLVTDSSRP